MVNQRVNDILAGSATSADELRALTKALKDALEFRPARALLRIGLNLCPGDVWMQQQLALCTYKDEELPSNNRLDDAISILEGIDLRSETNTDAETLGLAGAVYKRKWEYDGQVEHLWEALNFYRAANTRDPVGDKGYGGVNAAYILNILAARARTGAKRASTEPVEAAKLEAEATALRQAVAEQLNDIERNQPTLRDQYWFAVTRAEIAFGLRHYEEADGRLAHASRLRPSEWELQTTFRQLVVLARLQGCGLPPEGTDAASWHPAWRALAALLGTGTERALSCYRGKVGLALSGGGFRASFYHLGVMARLAEMDALRGVDVLSTVSGGSIVGAHYYLELQRLLQTAPDEQITRDDYVAVVRRVQERFLAGVQRNLRMRALADARVCLRLATSKTYSRSNRMGELYETELYARVPELPASTSGAAPPRLAGQPRRMSDLVIHPATDSSGRRDTAFKPKFSNWRRRAKVPVLLINTTSLNSGHLWHFTATWMGEPPGLLGAAIDANLRYRRLYYAQAPTPSLQEYPLGYAVAASACVPGLFEPLVIDGLYQDRIVRLVDGGVHDNQGVAGLLDEGCSLILCSDASGQLKDIERPPGGLLSPLMRSSQSIFMDRIRETEYQDLRKRVDSHALTGLFFVHLKKDLQTQPLDWVNCQDPTLAEPPAQTAPYGIDVELQRRLAGIRTDLDSFTEVEAYALMMSGYAMTKQEFEHLQQEHEKAEEQGAWGGFDVTAPSGDWPFLALQDVMRLPASSGDPRRADLGAQLRASSSLFFKVWQLAETRDLVNWGGGLVVAVVAAWWLVAHVFGVPLIGVAAVAAAASAVAAIWNWFIPDRPLHNYPGRAVGALLGYVVAHFHLRFFDPKYLARGKLSRLLERK